MSANSKIEWTDHSWNPWEGCTKKSPGCKNCYAEARNKRFSGGANWGKGKPRRRTSEATWRLPIRWDRHAGSLADRSGKMPELRPRVFPSLCDWLDGEVPIEWLADFLRLIFLTPNLTWLLLTKSPENFRRRLLQAFTWIVDANEAGPWSIPCEMWLQGWLSKEKPIPPGNVVIGVSVENQKYADERREVFKSIPARVKFVSYEPALENVDWSGWEFVDQVIFGGESGPGARECDPQWGRNALAFCREHGISFFCKQLGGHIITNGITGPGQHWPRPTGLLDTGKGYFRKHLVDRKGGDPSEWPEDLRVREFPMGKTTNVHE